MKRFVIFAAALTFGGVVALGTPSSAGPPQGFGQWYCVSQHGQASVTAYPFVPSAEVGDTARVRLYHDGQLVYQDRQVVPDHQMVTAFARPTGGWVNVYSVRVRQDHRLIFKDETRLACESRPIIRDEEPIEEAPPCSADEEADGLCPRTP